MWLRRPVSVSRHCQLSLLYCRGRLMSSNPCCSGLRRQTAEGVVRGVAYRRRQRVLLAARLECRLAAGSRPRNGDEHRSLRCRQWESLLAIGDFVFVFVLYKQQQRPSSSSHLAGQPGLPPVHDMPTFVADKLRRHKFLSAGDLSIKTKQTRRAGTC